MAKENFLYMQICERIRNDILSGQYKEGDKLPTDIELQKQMNVSLITIKKALGILKEEGILKRSPGIGTIVQSTVPTVNSDSIVNEQHNDRISVKPVAQSQKKIGIVLEHVSDSFGLELLYRLDELLMEQGYRTCIRFSNYDRSKETTEIQNLMNDHVDGLIIMPCHGTYYNSQILRLVLDHFPIVLIDKKMEGIKVPSIRTDNKLAIRQLVDNLYEQGCRNICYLTRDITGTSSLQERYQGYRDGLRKYMLPFQCLSIPSVDGSFLHEKANSEIIQIIDSFLTEHATGIDGVICSEYSLSATLLQTLRQNPSLFPLGFRLSYMDGERYGLSTGMFPHILQDEAAIAKKAVEVLTAKIKGEKVKQDYLIPFIFEDGINTYINPLS